MIVERARPRPGAAAGPETRTVVAGARPRAASVERTDLDVASEALLCYEAAEARAVAAEALVALTETRARAAEVRAVTANTRAHAAEARVAAAETQARAAQEDRVRAYVTATELQVANSGLLAKLDASEAAAAAATARAAETEAARESLESQLKDCVGVFHATATAESVMSPGEDLPDPDYPSPPYEPLPMPLAYVPGVSPLVLGPVAPGPLPWSWAPLLQLGGTPPPDTIFQGTVIDFGPKGDSTGKRRYGFIRVDHTQSRVFVRSKDAPDGYLSEGDRCEFRIVECRNRSNSQKGTLQWKAVDVVCVQRASPVPETPQPSC